MPTTVPLDWASVAGATGYDFQVLEGSEIVAQNQNGPVEGSRATVNLAYGHTYRWRTRARVAAQNNPWSSYWLFSTGVAPGPPVLQSPDNDASDVELNVNLDWGSVPGATGYDYQVLNGDQVVVENSNGPIQTSSVRVVLDYDTSYRWRTRARVLPQNNPWSGYWSFATIGRPTAPILLYPTASIQIANPVVFTWTPSRTAVSYNVEIWRGGSMIRKISDIAETSLEQSLPPGTQYQWRVRCYTAVGELRSQFSSFSIISTNNEQLVPEFASPLDDAEFVLGENVLIQIGALAEQVGANNDDTSDQVSSIELFVNSAPLATLRTPPYEHNWMPSVAGTYALSARVINRQGQIGVSESPILITVTNCPACPLIRSHPSDQPVQKGTNATFAVIAEAPGALSYQWQFANSPDGEHPSADVWQNIPSATANTLNISSADWPSEGFYRVLVRNGPNQVKSREARLSLAEDDEDVSIVASARIIPTVASGSLEANGILDTLMFNLEAKINQQANSYAQSFPLPDDSVNSPLVFSAIGVSGDGTVLLRINCKSGCKVRVFASDDLHTWTALGDTISADGQIIVQPSLQSKARFFKLQSIE
ncbi:MAG: immunoglobulin domain-containing protein [Spirulinaceae cyanobacterium RM2_2_10]|nr:immunoglobulin domain-containing protein [Spirulinaceae cyanobacterium RM2_2_10]